MRESGVLWKGSKKQPQENLRLLMDGRSTIRQTVVFLKNGNDDFGKHAGRVFRRGRRTAGGSADDLIDGRFDMNAQIVEINHGFTPFP